ncbi:ABC transporter ATP-binding protein [Spongiimicrobium salis]|uniref:ABC transporter ATP-binding protein n=1 Tax=Spongiimicrobium salis TaxID=1667022 RepID=UPI00374CB31A
MIAIQDLGYYYSKKKPLFDALRLHFFPGKIYGLLGKNGAGKSTLIKHITGMLFPNAGNCKVFGYVPQNREVNFLKEIFFVPEEYYLPNLKIQILLNTYKGFYPNFNTAQFMGYLKEFKIGKDRKTSDLSLGQKKKIAIGFALATNTKVLIMDEPTNGLDIPSKITFRKMVKDAFAKNRIVIITSHQVRDLDELIDHLIIMNQGRILLDEDKNHIAQRLLFEVSRSEPHGNYIYKEQLSHGYATIGKNTTAALGYVDIELLFNAVLFNEDRINLLLQS